MNSPVRATIGLTLISMLALATASGCASSDEPDGGNGATETTSSGATGGGGGFVPPTGGAGGGNNTGGQGAGTETFPCGEASSVANLEKLPADLIIAVDNSDSMALESAQVKTYINAMVGAVTASNIDAHVVVISKPSNNTIFDILETGVCVPAPLGSGSCPDDENLPGYRHVVEQVESHDALDKIVSTYDQWKGSLRPEATKTFLVVSDDESDMTAQEFTTALAGLNPPIVDFKFNAIVASQEGPLSCGICAITGCQNCANPCCDKGLACFPVSQQLGQTYIDLQGQTSGVYGDLCTQNFGPVFDDMATAVIEHTPIACHFDIPAPPEGIVVAEETNVDFIPAPNAGAQPIYNVEGQHDCTINGGWYFDNAYNPTEIHLCPATCSLVQESTEGEVHVEFGCETQTSPS